MRSDQRGTARSVLRLTSALALVFCGAQAFSQPAKTDSAPASSTAASVSATPAASGAPAATAVPTSESSASTPAASAPPSVALPVVAPKPKAPKAPDPTPAQVNALAELQREAQLYETDARDYRSSMTRIIQHHYREKKKRVLRALDREIEIENKGLRNARDEAIRRLEAFVARYSGANAHPDNTPDAMFRLAALLEERARDAAESAPIDLNPAPPEPDLGPTIALYKRLVREFPNYKERAGVYYYLGHALNDGGRLEEAQQVWRALVCSNRFSYPVAVDPKDPSRDALTRMPQDHEPDWWLGWMARHPEPMDKKREKDAEDRQRREKGAKRKGAVVQPEEAPVAEVTDDEDSFKNPFPEECRPLPQVVEPGDQPRYLGEVWWRIGDYHFDEIDPWGGPYNLLRAEVAYGQAMKFDRPPVYDVSMYKLAWTYFKQQRYETAVRQFVRLLELTDRREKETGNPGADFRAEAYAYIAGSITYLDFKGPPSGDPYIARNDVFDLYSDTAQIEDAMRPAITRLQDSSLIPQDRKWTIDVYRALSVEFKEYNQLHNFIEVSELILKKWPNHRDAPIVQNQVALTYETLSFGARGAEAERFAAKALEARGKLVDYVEQPGRIPEWVEKNKEDPEAIRAAEQIVRGGLRRAAADHTNAARRWVKAAREAGDEGEKQQAFTRALNEYRAAGVAWGSYLNQDENADDVYDTRFWLADSYVGTVLVEVELGRVPSEKDAGLAQEAARNVRDSNDNDEKLQPAAQMVVNVAQAVVRANYRRSDETSGAEGFPLVREVKTEKYEEEGEQRERVVPIEPPAPLRAVIAALDEYVKFVPIEKEPDPTDPNHNLYAYNAAEALFLYGQFADAKGRLEKIYTKQCGATKFGFQAWKKLVTMAAIERDFERSKRLAEENKKKSCALSDADRVSANSLGTDILNSAIFKEAYAAFDKAQKLPDTAENAAERTALYTRAASLYEEGLQVDPGRDEAPEAAINGAISHKQLGNYDKAIAMYELFIGAYGKDDALDSLQKGDKAKNVAPQLERYAQRVRYLKLAYDALAESYVLFFDYRKAAQTYDKISAIEREVPALKEKDGTERPMTRGFDPDSRRGAAQNAVFLYLSIGEPAKVEATKKRFFAMNPPREQQAEIEWLIVEGDVKAWDERAPDRAENRVARQRALGSMESFYLRWSKDSAGYGHAVRAAGTAAKLRRAVGDPKADDWCTNTISTFESYRGVAAKDDKGNSKALGSVQAELAAECEYRRIDEDIKKNFDYESNHNRYKGVLTDVVKDFEEAVNKVAKGYTDRLQAVVEKYQSPRWTIAARARRGTLYDSTRTGLYNTREPALKLYSDEQKPMKLCAILKKPKCSEVEFLKELDKQCTETGSEASCTAYDSFTAKRRTDWKTRRDSLIDGADKVMVASYTEAIALSQYSRVRTKEVDMAIARLAFHQDIIGDAKLREHSSSVRDPNHKDDEGKPLPFEYVDGMFPRMRRGLGVPLSDVLTAAPLPGGTP
ncbi:MAG: tetratricopeptide repeat protein [Deltaproteobacteria bacterium]|nr:tetratricopeptide repeat protein [Deltaproteobacteria bacterium]